MNENDEKIFRYFMFDDYDSLKKMKSTGIDVVQVVYQYAHKNMGMLRDTDWFVIKLSNLFTELSKLKNLD